MTRRSFSTAPHEAFAYLARNVTEKPCQSLTDRAAQHKRNSNGLKRLLAAIDRLPVESKAKRAA